MKHYGSLQQAQGNPSPSLLLPLEQCWDLRCFRKWMWWTSAKKHCQAPMLLTLLAPCFWYIPKLLCPGVLLIPQWAALSCTQPHYQVLLILLGFFFRLGLLVVLFWLLGFLVHFSEWGMSYVRHCKWRSLKWTEEASEQWRHECVCV